MPALRRPAARCFSTRSKNAGVPLIGRPWGEVTVLRAGAALAEAMDWTRT
jgi:Asp-tRNA(Asn)/Glu-tRNA(Gln) amidotransferase A subunit family amidase